LTSEQFDIIQADAIHPWKSHSGMMYSREFFEQARRRLAANGIMAQWTPTERTRSTFMATFPYGIQIGQFLMIGSDQPVHYDGDAVLARLDDPDVRAHLARGRIDPSRVRAFLPNQTVAAWTPDTRRTGEINTDLHPRDEYYLNN
jgi:hypothetical protein